MRIYLSSTYMDLVEHREAVRRVLQQLRPEPTIVCMENYTAGPRRPVDQCLEDVKSCDAYIGLLAWRYGYIDEDYPGSNGRSITELEYRQALESKVPVLFFVVDAKIDWPDEFREEGPGVEKLRALREEVMRDWLVGEFTDPLDLALAVSTAVANERTRQRDEAVATTWDPGQVPRAELLSALLSELKEQASAGEPADPGPEAHPIVGPVPTTKSEHFQNRIAELQMLWDSIADDAVRLLLVCGRGGVGKTALVSKLVRELRPALEDGAEGQDDVGAVVYVSLRQPEARSVDSIAELIISVLPSDVADDAQMHWNNRRSLSAGLEYLFHRALADRRRLIILDNFEDVLDDDNHIRAEYGDLARFIEAGLEYDHDALMIATTRRSLALPLELEGRAGQRRVELRLDEGLPPTEGARLLRALDVDGKAGLRDAPEDVLATIVERCQGIPRVLETLVGTLIQSRTLTLEGILADELTFAHLVENPARELYDGLPSDEQRAVMQALSVYNTPVPAAAVRCMLPELPINDILETLARDYVVTYDAGLFSLHPLDQEYVYGTIPEEGEGSSRPALHKLAAEYFAATARPASQRRALSDVEPQLRQIHHLMAAGEYDESARVLSTVKSRLDTSGAHAQVIDVRERLLGRLTDPVADRRNRGDLSEAYGHVGRPAEALELMNAVLEEARDAEAKGEVSQLLRFKGVVLYEAMGHAQKAMECFMEADGKSRFGNGNVGVCYGALGQTNRAVLLCRQAVASSWGRLQASHRESLANVLGEAGSTEDALAVCREGIKIARNADFPRAEGYLLNTLGQLSADSADAAMAAQHFAEAAEVGRSIHCPEILAPALEGMAYMRHVAGDVAAACPLYEDALELGASVQRARGASRLGIAYLAQGDHDHARRHLQEAVDRADELLDACPGLVRQLYARALALLGMGADDEAKTAYQQAVALGPAHGLVRRALADLELLQHAAPSTPGLGHVEQLLRQALDRPGELHLETNARRTLNAAGLDYMQHGDFRLAQQYLEQAVELAREQDDERNVAVILGNLGVLEIHRGDAEASIDYSSQGLAVALRLGIRRTEGVITGNIAYGRFMLGEIDASLALNAQALEIAREVGNRLFEGLHQGNIGRALLEIGDLEGARAALTTGVEIAREVNDPLREAMGLADLGHVQALGGDTATGKATMARALDLSRERSFPRAEVGALLSLGWCALQVGDTPKALAYHAQARDLARKSGARLDLSRALLALTAGRAHAADIDGAWGSAQQALELDIQRHRHVCALRLSMLALVRDADAASEWLSRAQSHCREQLERTARFHEAIYALATAQLAGGRTDEALAHYREALDVCAAPGVVARVERDLALLGGLPNPPAGLAQAHETLAQR